MARGQEALLISFLFRDRLADAFSPSLSTHASTLAHEFMDLLADAKEDDKNEPTTAFALEAPPSTPRPVLPAWTSSARSKPS